MATDFYLQLDGLKGESADSMHLGWIECTSIDWAIDQPKSATASTGGGHTAERAELSDISIGKLIDLSSPILAQACAWGKTIPKAKLEMLRADGDGVPIKYFEVELDNVLIAHISPSFASGEMPNECVRLKFSKVKWNTRNKGSLAVVVATQPVAGTWRLIGLLERRQQMSEQQSEAAASLSEKARRTAHELSGAHWANRYPGSTSLRDLRAPFRD